MWSIARPAATPGELGRGAGAAGRLRRGAGATAAFARIAAAVIDDVERGALRPGDRLPSSRDLAARLGVARNTVVAAYDELDAQGWLDARGPAGTFVSSDLPARRATAARRGPAGLAAAPGFALVGATGATGAAAGPPARYQMSVGVPDPRLAPRAAIARAWRRAIVGRGGAAALDYGDPRGAPRLRAAIAAMLRETRAVPCGAEHVMITRGSQQAIALAARLVVRPGATAVVEALGYRPAWTALALAGARLVGGPLDGHGLDVDALGAGARPGPLACFYVTPHHQYPTTVLMAPARRLALLARARADGAAVIEDDYDHEFHFDGRPVAPLAARDPGGSVVYVGTLSKILAPGLRLGFVVAPPPVIEAMAALRLAHDRQGDHVLELAAAAMIEDGELERHVRRARRVYGDRRAALVRALARELGGAVDVRLPAGGLTVWARVDDGVDPDAWAAAAAARGVALVTARELALDGAARPFVRLGFAVHDEAELAAAVRLLAAALAEARRARGPRARRAARGAA